MRMKPILALLLGATLCTAPEAIVIRHDREDDAYRVPPDRYPMVCRVGGGMGTLIHPEWILTAAHVAAAAGQITCLGQIRDLREVFLHPDYADPEKHRDLGLIRLKEPVEGALPVRLYRRADEPGMRATLVGDGQTGTGSSGPRDGERLLRAAHNTVESAGSGWLTFVFDRPPAGDDLEGISGPGDSGGPALVQQSDELRLIGVSAFNEGDPPCLYGTTEHYARVSDELEWIEGVLEGKIRQEATPRAMRYGTGPDGQQTVQREEPETVYPPVEEDAAIWLIVDKLTETANAGKARPSLTLFSDRLLEQHERAGDPILGVLEFLVGVVELRGKIERFHPLGRSGFRIPDSGRTLRPVVFHLKDGTPGYFGLGLDAEGKHCTKAVARDELP